LLNSPKNLHAAGITGSGGFSCGLKPLKIRILGDTYATRVLLSINKVLIIKLTGGKLHPLATKNIAFKDDQQAHQKHPDCYLIDDVHGRQVKIPGAIGVLLSEEIAKKIPYLEELLHFHSAF